MSKNALFVFFTAISAQCAFIQASETQTETTSYPNSPTPALQNTFTAFTGKVLRNKVRLRLEPNLNSAVVRELSVNDMLLAVGETENFYAVEPPADIKAYIYRTYVLDGIIEGNHVNVRLEPELSAPVIAQLNSGDPIKGTISPTDKKWMEITPPSTTRFYVAKEYLEKVGSASLITNQRRRWEEASSLVSTARTNSQIELQKPFDQINIEISKQKLDKVISQYADFPEEVARAHNLLTEIQTAYLNKKLQFIESNTATIVTTSPTPTVPAVSDSTVGIIQPSSISKSAVWNPIEDSLYEAWLAANNSGNLNDFYSAQEENSIALRGILEPYNRAVKNKPGDYLLIHPHTRQPIAFVYSTRVNLHEKIGEEVSVKVSPRDNQNFAYFAYYVLAVY